MSRFGFFFSALFALLLTSPAAAAQRYPIPLRFVTIDGTWDCKDETGTPFGAVVVLGAAYGLLDTESKPSGYGNLRRTGEDNYDLPHYLILDGLLKERDYVALHLRGPKEDYENYSTGFFLAVVNEQGHEAECARRLVPGMVQ